MNQHQKDLKLILNLTKYHCNRGMSNEEYQAYKRLEKYTHQKLQ